MLSFSVLSVERETPTSINYPVNKLGIEYNGTSGDRNFDANCRV